MAYRQDVWSMCIANFKAVADRQRHLQAGERGRTGNAVMDSGWARIGLRIVPDMDAERCAAALGSTHLRTQVPVGMELVASAANRREFGLAVRLDHPLLRHRL
jgi:hypothetical protein